MIELIQDAWSNVIGPVDNGVSSADCNILKHGEVHPNPKPNEIVAMFAYYLKIAQLIFVLILGILFIYLKLPATEAKY